MCGTTVRLKAPSCARLIIEFARQVNVSRSFGNSSSARDLSRYTSLSAATQTGRVATCTYDLFDRRICILTCRIREIVKSGWRVTILEDWIFLKFY